MIEDLIRKNRSCRRFYQSHKVDLETLKRLANLGRLSASAANLQPLKYILACDVKTNAQIFPCLEWAGYLKNWPGPEEGERPSAYIVILGDTDITKNFGCDHGIASQSITLGAREMGLACCIIEAINRKKLEDILHIAPRFTILLVIAMGKPREKVVLEAVGPDGDVRYWRDDKKIHHVPKRSLNDSIIDIARNTARQV